MAPMTYTLLTLKDAVTETDLVSALQKSPSPSRPLFVGKCQHWIHPPHLSAAALLNTESGGIKRWDYLLVHLPTDAKSLNILSNEVKALISETWTISANGVEAFLTNYNQQKVSRLSTPVPTLPTGWNPEDYSGLDAAVAPPDLEASLALKSCPLGTSDTANKSPVVLKDFVRDFGTRHNGRIAMFNLLSYMPGEKARYLEYRAVFAASVGSKYGGAAIFASDGVDSWTSKDAEKDGDGGWEDVALVHYPSIWHFGKMLDDPEYADADRRFKQGAIRDNSILCITEVEV